MTFRINKVVPWGRSFEEYDTMFQLNENNKAHKIASFGDGPASFNCEATKAGYSVFSFDPIYQFSKEQLEDRIEEARKIVMQQARENQDNYVWTNIKSLEDLEHIRMSAMNTFLNDFEKGKLEGRYVYHQLPDKLPISDDYFDIGLSSHFLFLYKDLGYVFHTEAISEMLRVCKEVRIFPIIDINGDKTELVNQIIDFFSKNYIIDIIETSYEFQRGGSKLLVIRK